MQHVCLAGSGFMVDSVIAQKCTLPFAGKGWDDDGISSLLLSTQPCDLFCCYMSRNDGYYF